ncbi:Uncharacterised protein PB.6388, partial [Pycnogonum litorale]
VSEFVGDTRVSGSPLSLPPISSRTKHPKATMLRLLTIFSTIYVASASVINPVTPLFDSDFGPFFPGKGEDKRVRITYPTPATRPNFHTIDVAPLFVNYSDALMIFNLNDSIATYDGKPTSIPDDPRLWTLTANGQTRDLDGSSGEIIPTFPPLPFFPVILNSPVYNTTKCLYFSAYTSIHTLHFVLATNLGHTMTVSGIPANKKFVSKITLGASIVHPYQIMMQLFSSAKPDAKIGQGIIGDIIIEDGPCSGDPRNLNCSFETGLCDWILHSKKYIWYPVPFGPHDFIPHKIEYGALGAFGGDGKLWSPLVRAVTARCFSFLYVKGESPKSYLRVWLLHHLPGGKEIQVLLYEDASPFKVFKKLVQVNIFADSDFQIGFQGRS